MPFPDPERHFPAESETQPELPGALPAPAGLLPRVFRGAILVLTYALIFFFFLFHFFLPKLLGTLILL